MRTPCVMTLNSIPYLWHHPRSPRILVGGLGVLGTIRYTQSEELEEALTWMDEQSAAYPMESTS